MNLPTLDVKILDKDRRSDGVVLMTLGRNTRSLNKTSELEAIIAIDQSGEIVWHRLFDCGIMDCRRSLSETLLVMATDGRAMEIGLDGTLIHQWYCAPRFPEGATGVPLDTLKLHHTICEISPGRYLSLSIEHNKLKQPLGEFTHFMADTVVIFDRQGHIEQEISTADILDETRISYGAEAPYWIHQGWPATMDWSHGNSAILDPKDEGIILSFRHQDAVVKITQEGELVWILGEAAGWQGGQKESLLKIEGGRAFYHQHDPSFLSTGELMLFDNGASGSMPPNPLQPLEERESFGLAYAIDEQTRTATETWRYGGADLPYTQYVSGICEMPNNNRFIACAGLKHALDGSRVEFPPIGVGSMVFKEVTLEGDVVFEAEIKDPDAVPEEGWNGFRPEYLPPILSQKLTN